MDWSSIWEIGKAVIPILVLVFGLGRIMKEVAVAVGSSVRASTEAGDFAKAISDMIGDGKITKEEWELAKKEFDEMIAAGKVAGNEWRNVYDSILEKFKRS